MLQTDTVAAVRRFNRFYTRALGVLERSCLDGPYTLAETRVLYEIAAGGGVTPSVVRRALGLDAGYLSRILARLDRDGLVTRTRSPSDGRSIVLGLTAPGEAFFAQLDAVTVAQVESLIGGLSSPQKMELADALEAAQTLLEPQAAKPPIVLRPHEVLTAARAIYAAAGFKMVDRYVHDDFGKPEVSETWKLAL